MPVLSGVKNFLVTDNARQSKIRGKLNLVAAAEAHIVWKARLEHHVQGTIRESLNAAPLGQDGLCQLGSWIRGSVLKPFCGPEVHRQLSEAHEQFHQLGDLIIEKLKAGDRRGAEMIFINEYTPSLRRMIQALTVINRHMHDA